MTLKVRQGFKIENPQKCLVGQFMELLGGAWTPALIWNLSKGARRFNELKYYLQPISSKMLSHRLNDLQKKKIIIRKVIDTKPPSVEYELTKFGIELLPALEKMALIGEKIQAYKLAELSQEDDNIENKD